MVVVDIITVKLSKKTRDKLAELGRKNETYENIIVRFMEFYPSNSQGKRNSGRGTARSARSAD